MAGWWDIFFLLSSFLPPSSFSSYLSHYSNHLNIAKMISSSLSFHFSSHLRSATLPDHIPQSSKTTCEDRSSNRTSTSSVPELVPEQQEQSTSRKQASKKEGSSRILKWARYVSFSFSYCASPSSYSPVSRTNKSADKNLNPNAPKSSKHGPSSPSCTPHTSWLRQGRSRPIYITVPPDTIVQYQNLCRTYTAQTH